ncbi:ACT domain-containing protein [uncultured Imperialibacter sp.]|uniref:ACT domain-containing protein n=1 Tax=uncultured Imperialibacter sp. TaxID=1672639 RepID=UPI0030DAE59A|tara:strand:- start:204 stop:602 length:399 start_codon:yes stop_codon:yes gene_type:complete
MAPTGETDLKKLLKTLKPCHHSGDFVFCVVNDLSGIDLKEIVMLFREEEGNTIILKKELADRLHLPYSFVASWITLSVHSSLTAVGLTAAFSNALAEKGISCNVVAAFYHDHIFVDKKDTDKAMAVLARLSE